MNQCIFYGRLVSNPVLKQVYNTNVVTLQIQVETFRKSNNLDKKLKDTVVIECEAWDSAAQTIYERCSTGDFLLVNCKFKGKNFRINEFSITRRGDNTTQKYDMEAGLEIS